MTEIMPVPRNSNITVLRPPSILSPSFLKETVIYAKKVRLRYCGGNRLGLTTTYCTTSFDLYLFYHIELNMTP